MGPKAFGSRGGFVREERVVSESIQTATCRIQYERIFLRVIILLYTNWGLDERETA